MSQAKEEASDGDGVIYPELLSKDQLLNVLQSRCANLSDLHKLQKAELVELCHKYVTPRPQRKYRINRRGMLMTKLQGKKRSSTEMAEVDGLHQVNGVTLSSTNSRIKPPPSAINPERKVIKLGATTGTRHRNEVPMVTSTSEVTSPTAAKRSNDIQDRLKPPPPAINADRKVIRLGGAIDTHAQQGSTITMATGSSLPSPTADARAGILRLSVSPSDADNNRKSALRVSTQQEGSVSSQSPDDQQVATESPASKKFKRVPVAWP